MLLALVNPVKETPTKGAQPAVGVAAICEKPLKEKKYETRKQGVEKFYVEVVWYWCGGSNFRRDVQD